MGKNNTFPFPFAKAKVTPVRTGVVVSGPGKADGVEFGEKAVFTDGAYVIASDGKSLVRYGSAAAAAPPVTTPQAADPITHITLHYASGKTETLAVTKG